MSWHENIKNTELKPIAILHDLLKTCPKFHNSKPCYASKRIGTKPDTCQEISVSILDPEHDTLVSISTAWDTLISSIPSTRNDTIPVTEVLWSPDWPMSCTSIHLSPIASVLLIHSLIETLSIANRRMIKLSLLLAVKSLWISICGEKAVCRMIFETGTLHFISILFESNFNPAFLFDFRTYVTTLNIILTCAAMIWL